VPPNIRDEELPRLDAKLTALSEDAILQVGRFDAEVGMLVAPFSALLLRSESASSSEIERLTAGPRAIAMAEIGRAGGANAKLVVANARAMEAAIRLADDFDGSSIIEMQRVLLEGSAPEQTGQWRDEPVWVGGVGNSPHGAEFVPPQHSRVPHLMDDLVAFARRSDLPALTHIAIAHAQFETIHPFSDGNGRTGRALVQSMLRRLGVTTNTTVPVSAGLLQNTDRYFDALTAYRSGAVEPIVEVFTDAAVAAVVNGRMLVDDLETVRAEWHESTSARRGSGAYRALDVLTRQQVIDANYLSAQLGITPQNAQIAIDRLIEDGILTQSGSARRNRVYEAPAVSQALDEFARRSRRRSIHKSI
jgi:Fic family protein